MNGRNSSADSAKPENPEVCGSTIRPRPGCRRQKEKPSGTLLIRSLISDPQIKNTKQTIQKRVREKSRECLQVYMDKRGQ